MCAGSLLANCGLNIVFMRLLNDYRIEKVEDSDYFPISDNSDPTSLLAIPKPCKARFVQYDEAVLIEALDAEVS